MFVGWWWWKMEWMRKLMRVDGFMLMRWFCLYNLIWFFLLLKFCIGRKKRKMKHKKRRKKKKRNEQTNTFNDLIYQKNQLENFISSYKCFAIDWVRLADGNYFMQDYLNIIFYTITLIENKYMKMITKILFLFLIVSIFFASEISNQHKTITTLNCEFNAQYIKCKNILWFVNQFDFLLLGYRSIWLSCCRIVSVQLAVGWAYNL